MLRTRLIPVLLLQEGLLVRSETFSVHQAIGNPIFEAKRFNEWNVDELIYLDISRADVYDQRRDDHKVTGLSSPMKILEEVSKTCFMPLTWGGRIQTVEQMRTCLSLGADKVAMNTAAYRRPELVQEGAKAFGSQAMVVSVDVRRHADGRCEVVLEGGRVGSNEAPETWVKRAIDHGAGEILLQSVDRDGTARGYDTALIESVCAVASVPVIALGGVGRYEHYVDAVRAGASAVAAANIFHFKELSDRNGKRVLARAGVSVRT